MRTLNDFIKKYTAKNSGVENPEKKAAQAAELEIKKCEAERERLKSIGIPDRYLDATFDNWIADTPDKKAAVEKVKTAWTTNLFIYGKTGTGKTHLAISLVRDGAVYRRLPDLFREARGPDFPEQYVINKYGASKLLILDEIGRQKFSDFEHNLFFEIIDKRYGACLPTTLITNLSPQEIVAKFGAAVFDRLMPTKIHFYWESMR
jgi:DNA replication protein DnaC